MVILWSGKPSSPEIGRQTRQSPKTMGSHLSGLHQMQCPWKHQSQTHRPSTQPDPWCDLPSVPWRQRPTQRTPGQIAQAETQRRLELVHLRSSHRKKLKAKWHPHHPANRRHATGHWNRPDRINANGWRNGQWWINGISRMLLSDHHSQVDWLYAPGRHLADVLRIWQISPQN